MNTTPKSWVIACRDCDLLHRQRELAAGERAVCSRCGALLYSKKRNSLDHTLAFSLTGFVLFCMANSFPFLTFKYEGRTQESILITGVKELFLQDMWAVAVVVLAVSLVVPFIKIAGMLYVLVPLRLNQRPWYAAWIFRIVEALHPWAMVDVYMVGVIVAMVKLSDFSIIVPGAALFSFAGLLISMAVASATLDAHDVWDRLDAVERMSRS